MLDKEVDQILQMDLAFTLNRLNDLAEKYCILSAIKKTLCNSFDHEVIPDNPEDRDKYLKMIEQEMNIDDKLERIYDEIEESRIGTDWFYEYNKYGLSIYLGYDPYDERQNY